MPTMNWRGGLGMQRVVHERRKHAPPRRELTLRKAAELAGLVVEDVEAEVLPGVWAHVLARKGMRLIALDAWANDSKAMKRVRAKKRQAFKDAGIPYLRIRVTSPEESGVLILKALLKEGRHGQEQGT